MIIIRLRLLLKTIILMFVRLQQKILVQVFISLRDIEGVDALITNQKGVTLVTYYADCTPLFFVDTNKKAIGLAHAGWRGTVGRIGEKVVQKMTELYGTNPSDLKCAIGLLFPCAVMRLTNLVPTIFLHLKM